MDNYPRMSVSVAHKSGSRGSSVVMSFDDALSTTGFARGKTANLQGGITLEHLALCEKLLSETVVGGVAGEVGQGNAVVGKTKELWKL